MRGLFLRPVLWPAIKVTGDSNWVFSTKIMVAIHSVFSLTTYTSNSKSWLLRFMANERRVENEREREERRQLEVVLSKFTAIVWEKGLRFSPSFIWPKLFIPTSVCFQLFLHHHLVITTKTKETKKQHHFVYMRTTMKVSTVLIHSRQDRTSHSMTKHVVGRIVVNKGKRMS